eukprot:gene3829-4219_t
MPRRPAAKPAGSPDSLDVPTLEHLAGEWFDPTAPPSAHAKAEDQDLPVVNNFYGSVATSPAGQRPADLFAVNALSAPPPHLQPLQQRH